MELGTEWFELQRALLEVAPGDDTDDTIAGALTPRSRLPPPAPMITYKVPAPTRRQGMILSSTTAKASNGQQWIDLSGRTAPKERLDVYMGAYTAR